MQSQSELDVAVVIGRFQPFHTGHAALLLKALEIAPRIVVILGSSFQARNPKNPFTWEERAAMIRATLDPAALDRVTFVPMRDYYDDRRWGKAVLEAVQAQGSSNDKVALVGFVKDPSSRYLTRFPLWKLVNIAQQGDIDATSLRQIYFEGEDPAATEALLSTLVPAPVAHYLKGWSRVAHFPQMKAEHLAIEESKKTWGTGPFVTVDAVVRAAGKVLLVKRANAPGRGLWAVPGGFLESRESVLQGAMRELSEETGLSLTEASLESALKGVAVFDHPDRSLRGRTITHAHFFDLKDIALPPIAAADDAAEARWEAIEALKDMEARFFEDHFHILDHFLSLTG
jgi:bifunctional NMN adenylyltransferase/nudix hydrolase